MSLFGWKKKSSETESTIKKPVDIEEITLSKNVFLEGIKNNRTNVTSKTKKLMAINIFYIIIFLLKLAYEYKEN